MLASSTGCLYLIVYAQMCSVIYSSADGELSLEAAIKKKTEEIRLAVSTLKRRLKGGDDSNPLSWIVLGKLACAPRPFRYHPLYGGSGNLLPTSATALIFDWVREIQGVGIKSVISLMHDRDWRCYASLDLHAASLHDFYERQGFEVAAVPYEDPHHKKSTLAEKTKTRLRVRQDALAAYDMLTKPVLVQCSAAWDRSPPVAAFICVMRGL